MTATLTRKGAVLAAFAASLVAALAVGTLAVGASTTNHTAPSVGHGENIFFKTPLDTNFCIDEASGAAQGRTVYMNECNAGVSQQWALTKNADGTNSMIDQQGMCLDATGRKAGDGFPLKVYNCSFGKLQRLRYTPAGLLQFSSTDLCLSIQTAGYDVAVSLSKCNSSSLHQQWKLAH